MIETPLKQHPSDSLYILINIQINYTCCIAMFLGARKIEESKTKQIEEPAVQLHLSFAPQAL
jgi:hypothetical protein